MRLEIILKKKSKMNTPVLLMVYKKPATTIKIIEALRKVHAKKIYISINKAPPQKKGDKFQNQKVKEIINLINWKCVIKLKKRKKYVDAYTSYNEAIKWFFLNEKEGIILEDDTLPNKSFFLFCAKLLKKYRYNKKISQICGSSFKNQNYTGNQGYFFSNYSLTWGYATWRRSIKDYDESMKDWPILKKNNYLFKILNNKFFVSYWSDIFDLQYKKYFKAWDYRWLYSNWVKNKLSIIPKKHLVQNIGFVKEATHTKIKYKDWFHDLETNEIIYFNGHPKTILPELQYDKWLSEKIFKIRNVYLKKKIDKNNYLKKIKLSYIFFKSIYNNF